ncbi:filamentous hemagglutinin N-terminal domain-containing protein [Selenomonas sp. FC4001]|uniref:filamentous hemagglutinin N-terminal domain-containing protein n=1 Tax=Selenomonas sp. FC4001 TaxID=1408313 RepID=UPI0018CBF204|nr:filamentous hemagglutinin N-terminal domain-containing protein [Selenomonas sp. FC4001]
MRQMALQVSIALVAGMFSVVPVVQGAPVGGTSDTATITYSEAKENNQVVGLNTKITSDVTNNVIEWQDFSVAAKEAVNFDANNYMNIVTGKNTSTINGAINGAGEIYIINPSGVVIGKGAEINTGSFYASTRDVSVTDAVAKAEAANLNSQVGLSDLIAKGTAANGAAMDIVNMGQITADTVVLEGKNIRLLNSADIKKKQSDNSLIANTNVTVRADDDGYIHVGSINGEDGTTDATTGIIYKAEKLTNTILSANKVEGYKLVYDDNTTVANVTNNTWSKTLGMTDPAAGNYMLAEDIDLQNKTNTVKGTFTGKVDGNFYAVKHATGDSGLFETTSNATIENIGIKDSIFTASKTDEDDGKLPLGALVMNASDTTLKNVYNENADINNAGYTSAGLVGKAEGLIIDSSYSTGDVLNGGNIEGAGLVGFVIGNGTLTNVVTNSYSIGKTKYGLIGEADGTNTKITFDKTYTNGQNYNFGLGQWVTVKNSVVVDNNGEKYRTTTIGNPIASKPPLTSKSFFTDTLSWDNISDTGGLENGTRATWRIYEGQSAPVLTAFQKGIKTTTYDFAYYDSEGKATTTKAFNDNHNDGLDMNAYSYTVDPSDSSKYLNDGLVYNGETLKVLDGTAALETSVDNVLKATSINAVFDNAYVVENVEDETGTTTKTSYGASTIDNKHIFYNADGQREATYSASAGQGKKALIYSDQQGYDLVGNNVSIAPRRVFLTNSLSQKKIIKEYDGNANAADYVSSLFSGDSTTATGILAVDSEDIMVKLGTDATAQFYDQNGTTTNADAGAEKEVRISGDLYLTDGTKTKGNWNAYAGSNYVVVDAKGRVVTSNKLNINGTVDAAIYQRRLTADLKNVELDKSYDKKDYVVDADGKAYVFTNENFSLDSSNIVSADAGKVSVTVAEPTDSTVGNAYYYDKSTGLKTANVGTHDVKIEGVGLTSGAGKNYVLVDGNGKIVYSEKAVINADGTIDNTVTPEALGTFNKDGKIKPRQISNKDFQWYYTNNATTPVTSDKADATKEYNNSVVFDAPDDIGQDNAGKAMWYVTNEGSDTGLLAGDSITFRVNSAEFTTAADSSGTATSDAGTAKGTHYSVTISGAAAKNYTFDDTSNPDITPVALVDGGTADVYGKGSITPRTIYVTYGDNANKQYDGDEKVYSDDKAEFGLSAGYLVYADDNAAHHLLDDDNSSVKITGTYQAVNSVILGKDVYYDAENNPNNPVREKTINYTATIMQNGKISSNYQFSTNPTTLETDEDTGATAYTDNTTQFDAGKGTITQRKLGELSFDEVSKTYDGNADVFRTVDAADNVHNLPLFDDDEYNGVKLIVSTGLVNNGTVEDKIEDVFYVNADGTLNDTGKGKLIAKYGDVDSQGKFTANANATRYTAKHKDAAGNDTQQKVQYTGLEDLLKNHNYTLADSQSNGQAVYGEGTILPYKITDVNAITLDRNEQFITKAYDGTTSISDPVVNYLNSTNANVKLNNTTTLTGEDGLSLTVSGAAFSTAHSDGKEIADENSAANTKQDVYFYVDDSNNTGNYDVDVTREADGDYAGMIKLTMKNAGIITPKHITANVVKNDNLVKEYDSNANVLLKGDKLIDISDQIQIIDRDVVKNDITATYVDANGALDVNASLTEKDKSVKYNLALKGDDHKDYFITNNSGDNYSVDKDGNVTANITGKDNFIKNNNGTIEKRVLTVTFDDVHKVYDGKDNVTNSGTDVISYTLADDDVAAADKVTLTIGGTNGVKGTYGSYDSNTGKFTADKNAGGKTVKYENLNSALTSTDIAKAQNISRNYKFESDTVYNTDTTNNYIDKAKIGLSDLKIEAKPVSQEYDGSTVVGSANSYIIGSYIDFGNNSKVDFTYDTNNVTAVFASTGSGTTIAGAGNEKDVTFSLSGITIPDDVVNNFEWESDDKPTADNGNITIDRTKQKIGEVTPREIYATINNPTVSKTYNAENDVLDSNNNPLSSAGLVSFSRVDGSTALVADLSDPDNPIQSSNESSAVYTDKNKGTNKDVKYTIAVSDGANYNIYYNQSDDNRTAYTTTDTNGDSVAVVGYTGTVETVFTPNNVINAKDLTLSFESVTKDYDGTTDVPEGMIVPNVPKLDGFASATDKNNIVLKDGYTAVFASPNVKGIDGNGTNYITYGSLDIDGPGSSNYNLVFKNADGTAGTAAETIGNGIINKYVLTQAPDIARNTNAVTKEYAGNTNANVAYQDDEDLTAVKNGYLQSVIVNINGKDQQLPFELTAASYANDDGSVTGTTGRGVTFSVKLDSDNIDFSSAPGSSSGEFTVNDTGTITPRKLYVSVDSTFNPSKVYDGETTVLDTLPTAVLSITNEDKIVSGESVAIDNTAATLNAQYKGKDAGTDKVVYTVQLLPSTTSGNYELVDADGNAITSIEGSGEITQRPVTISLKKPIALAAKAYNGSDAADATAIVGNYSLEVQNGGDTGILTTEVDEIDLDTDAVTATYANGGHVLRDTNTGAPIADTVNFGNFTLTSNNAVKPASNYILTPTTLQGKGKITPLTIAVDLDHSPEKVYDGTTDVDAVGSIVNKKLYRDFSNVIDADKDAYGNSNITVEVSSGNFTTDDYVHNDGHVKLPLDTKNKAYVYKVALAAINNSRAGDYELQLKNGSVRSFITSDYGQTATISGTDGNITPKTITFTAEDGINKTYDGTQVYDSAAAAAKVTFTGLADTDSKNTLNATITAVTTDDADATTDETDNILKPHDVQYTVTINNNDYQLGNTTDNAVGTISRQGLNIVATPVSVNVGDSVPASFNGSVQGLVKNNIVDDTGLADSFTFGPDGTLSTTTAGKYGIYGWYMGRKSGNFGRNYTFDQVPGNATAFTVNFVNNTDNPDTKITPTPDIYHKISKDMNSGFGDNDIAAIEYRNKKGTVIGTVTIDSGEVHSGGTKSGTALTDLGTDNTNLGKIGIAGGDIVNMEGADAASNASIAVSGDGTTVNLEVQSITDEMRNILDENSEAKIEKSEKEGKISIKSSDGQENDEIELTIEKEGVNVA